MRVCSIVVKELQIEDTQQYVNFLRMPAPDVETIMKFIGYIISKSATKMRQAISVKDGNTSLFSTKHVTGESTTQQSTLYF